MFPLVQDEGSSLLMPTIFVLYTRDDPSSVQRSEMLVGPMVLAGVCYGRFAVQDIDPATLKIRAQVWDASCWKQADNLLPDAILDYSRPGSQRTAQETALLSTIPHSLRTDLCRFDLLNLLAQDREFRNHIAPIRLLTNVTDLEGALSHWGSVILKSRSEKQPFSSLIVVPEEDNWRVHEPFSNRLMNKNELYALIRTRQDGRFFLQRFMPSRNPQGRQTTLHLTLQQRGDGCWMTPDIRGILATEGLFASLDTGGEFEGMPFKVNDFCPPCPKPQTDLLKLSSTVQRLGTAAARRIEELLPGPCASLGFSVAFDLQSKPWIISVTSRPVAPRRPGKNLEFFRHMTQFALGLARPGTSIPRPVPRHASRQLPQPVEGMTIMGQILPEQIDSFLTHRPQWVDLEVGNGGRALLAALSKRADSMNTGSTNGLHFFSLRLGVATSDIIRDPQSDRPKIKATEDYIGGGILRLGETSLMRSIRVPLLQAQLGHALRELNGYPPNLLWLEDADLGLGPLEPEQRRRELEQTVAWLDRHCAEGHAGSWGVILFNPTHPASLILLQDLHELAGTASPFTHVGVRRASVPTALHKKLAEYRLHPVLYIRNTMQNDSDMVQVRELAQAEGISLLHQWQPESDSGMPRGGGN